MTLRIGMAYHFDTMILLLRSVVPSLGGRELQVLSGALRHLLDPLKPGVRREELPKLVFTGLVDVFQPDIAAYYEPQEEDTLAATATHPTNFWLTAVAKDRFATRPRSGYAIGRALDLRRVDYVRANRRVLDDRAYEPFTSRIGTELILPIYVGEVPAAVVVLSRSYGRPFGDLDLQLAKAVADSLSDVYGHIDARTRESWTLKFLREGASASGDDTDTLFNAALTALSSLLPSRYISVWLYNKPPSEGDRWPLESLALRYLLPPEGALAAESSDSVHNKVIPVDDSLTGKTVRTKTAQVFRDIQQDELYRNREFALRHDLRWFVSVPILGPSEEVFGVINAYPSRSPQLFDNGLLDLISLLARQLAVSLRAALMQSTERVMLAYDNLFFQLLDEGGTREQWDQLAYMISGQLHCEACSIFFRSPTGDLALAGTTGIIGDPPYHTVRYAPGEGLTGECYSKGQARIYYREFREAYQGQHASKHRERLASSDFSRSIIFVPIGEAGDVAGVIRCNNKKLGPHQDWGRFTREDVLLLRRIGTVLADVRRKAMWARAREERLEKQVHGVHHELRDPVNGIFLLSDKLLQVMESGRDSTIVVSDRLVRISESIYSASVQINVLVRSMLGFDDDLGPLQMSDVKLLDALYTCQRWLQAVFRQNRVELEIEHLGNPIVRANREALQRLIYNLLANGAKYADRKEVIRKVAVRGSRKPWGFCLEVVDNGVGVPVGEERRIFIAGKRGSNVSTVAPSGSGLGLAFCQQIAAAHGWKISLRNRSKPTVFRVKMKRRK